MGPNTGYAPQDKTASDIRLNWELETDIAKVQRNWSRFYSTYRTKCVHRVRRQMIARGKNKGENTLFEGVIDGCSMLPLDGVVDGITMMGIHEEDFPETQKTAGIYKGRLRRRAATKDRTSEITGCKEGEESCTFGDGIACLHVYKLISYRRATDKKAPYLLWFSPANMVSSHIRV